MSEVPPDTALRDMLQLRKSTAKFQQISFHYIEKPGTATRRDPPNPDLPWLSGKRHDIATPHVWRYA